jgi:hypothetical protein
MNISSLRASGSQRRAVDARVAVARSLYLMRTKGDEPDDTMRKRLMTGLSEEDEAI